MPERRLIFTLLAAAVALAGCTARQVTPLQTAAEQMCIEENPKVKVSDFVPVLQAGFARHGITTQLYSRIPREHCPYVITYTARRSWDMAPYLSTAEIAIHGPRRQLQAKGNYHLRGKGGLSLMKWQGTQSKIDPLIDEMLANARLAPSITPDTPAHTPKPGLDQQLRDLQRQNLGYDDYQRAYRQLMLEHQGAPGTP